MTKPAPLMLGPKVQQKIIDLCKKAEENKIDVRVLLDTIKQPGILDAHMQQMNNQTIIVPGPFAFRITYSVETGHPAGMCRHLSMSIDRPNRMPSATSVWIVAQMFGFEGGLDACKLWNEHLSEDRVAINVVQPVMN